MASSMMKPVPGPKFGGRIRTPSSVQARTAIQHDEQMGEGSQQILFIDVPKSQTTSARSRTVKSGTTKPRAKPNSAQSSRVGSSTSNRNNNIRVGSGCQRDTSATSITETTAIEYRQHRKNCSIQPLNILREAQESECHQVFEINLHGKSISKIDRLENFTKVRILDLSCNHLSKIENLHNNIELREMKLYDNDIVVIEHLDMLKDLSTLQLQHNRIKCIGRGLNSLKRLKILRLDSNYIFKLDLRELATASQLTYLELSQNYLDNISAVNCLPNLEELYVTNNRIRTISDLSHCKKLQEVDFSHNRITDLSGLKGLPHLKIVHTSHNQLTTLKSLGKVKCLEELNVSENRLTRLSSLIAYYPAMQILDVSNNNIEAWDEVCVLNTLPELVELYIAGNIFSCEDGEMPQYHNKLQTMMPLLEILDGAHIKRRNIQPGTPLMRPMSAAREMSTRQVETQLVSFQADFETIASSVTLKFDKLRVQMNDLPDDTDADMFSRSEVRSLTPSSARPISRAGKRSRIQEAQMFASQHGANS